MNKTMNGTKVESENAPVAPVVDWSKVDLNTLPTAILAQIGRVHQGAMFAQVFNAIEDGNVDKETLAAISKENQADIKQKRLTFFADKIKDFIRQESVEAVSALLSTESFPLRDSNGNPILDEDEEPISQVVWETGSITIDVKWTSDGSTEVSTVVRPLGAIVKPNEKTHSVPSITTSANGSPATAMYQRQVLVNQMVALGKELTGISSDSPGTQTIVVGLGRLIAAGKITLSRPVTAEDIKVSGDKTFQKEFFEKVMALDVAQV